MFSREKAVLQRDAIRSGLTPAWPKFSVPSGDSRLPGLETQKKSSRTNRAKTSTPARHAEQSKRTDLPGTGKPSRVNFGARTPQSPGSRTECRKVSGFRATGAHELRRS